MAWWLWVLLGLALAGLELTSGGFYLVFLGVGALFTGLSRLLGFGISAWGDWLVFVVSSLVLVAFFRRRLLRAVRADPP